MKTLTIYQPHASLIAVGAKRFETRGWKTNYRGPIAIHAGLESVAGPLSQLRTGAEVLALANAFKEACVIPPDVPDWNAAGYLIGSNILPLGAVIATAELVECHCIVQHSPSTGRIVTDKGVIDPVGDELLFGDWRPGRYAWELANVTLLPQHVHISANRRSLEWLPLSIRKRCSRHTCAVARLGGVAIYSPDLSMSGKRKADYLRINCCRRICRRHGPRLRRERM